MKARLTGALLGVGALGLLVAPNAAFAQDAGATPSCGDATMFPNPIYLTGSTAFQPVIQAMAAQLNNRTTKITLIYLGSGSCAGASAVAAQTALTGNALYFPNATTTANCSLDATSPKADVGISDVFYETCGVGTRPAGVGDFPGPAQAMLFVVPSQATNAPTTITAEEAQNVWGCGARGMVSPWTVETAIQQRNSGSGTQNVVARAINVLASSFHGTMNAGGGNMIATLTQTGTPSIVIADLNTAVGFLAADAYDANRSTLKSLAFRGLEQTQAYYADSSATTFDKRNVRDGHYVSWGYEHFLARVDSSGVPSPQAQTFINWVQGISPTDPAFAPNFDPVQLMSGAHVIPTCAMKVQRKSDGGFLSPYTPSAEPCNCLFEATVNGGTPPAGLDCATCTDSTTCNAGKQCHHGYCE